MKIEGTDLVDVSSAGPVSSQLPDRATIASTRIYPQVGQLLQALQGDGPMELGEVAGRSFALKRVVGGIQVSMESPAGKQIAVLSPVGEVIGSSGGDPRSLSRLISTAHSLSFPRV
jgi:hypothetical protein